MNNSVVLCNVKRCSTPGELFAVSKPDGLSELHISICPNHFEEKAHAFVAAGYNWVRIPEPTQEVVGDYQRLRGEHDSHPGA